MRYRRRLYLRLTVEVQEETISEVEIQEETVSEVEVQEEAVSEVEVQVLNLNGHPLKITTTAS